MARRKAFTIIELVMVIVSLGILAVVALPKFFNLQGNAKTSAEKGVVGGVRTGIFTYYANTCSTGTCAYPATLDAAANGACTSANACFTNVLSQGGLTADWSKSGAASYIGPAGTVYTYTAATGEFR